MGRVQAVRHLPDLFRHLQCRPDRHHRGRPRDGNSLNRVDASTKRSIHPPQNQHPYAESGEYRHHAGDDERGWRAPELRD